jgi:hypothetical protein
MGVYYGYGLDDDVIHGNLDGPLFDLPSRLLVIQHLPKCGRSMHFDLVCLKIMG